MNLYLWDRWWNRSEMSGGSHLEFCILLWLFTDLRSFDSIAIWRNDILLSFIMVPVFLVIIWLLVNKIYNIIWTPGHGLGNARGNETGATGTGKGKGRAGSAGSRRREGQASSCQVMIKNELGRPSEPLHASHVRKYTRITKDQPELVVKSAQFFPVRLKYLYFYT